jgi:hypothetical protein
MASKKPAIKEAEAAVKTARVAEKATSEAWGAWHASMSWNIPTMAEWGQLYTRNLKELILGHEGKSSLSAEQITALNTIGHGYEPWATLAEETYAIVAKFAIGEIPTIGEIRAKGADYIRISNNHREASKALANALAELNVRTLEELGFPQARQGNALADMVEVVRTKHGNKFDFWAVSPTGGRYLIRNGTRPYVWCTLDGMLQGFFTTGAQHYVVRGVHSSFKHAIRGEDC